MTPGMSPGTGTLDLGGVLHDAWAMARRDRAVLIGVAGLFVLVPQLAQAMFVTLPPPWPETGADPAVWQAWLDAASAWGVRNDPLLIVLAAASIFGSMTILRLYVDPARPDVATALRLGVAAFPRFLLLALAVALPVNLGVLLLLLPGLYLKGRLFVAGPAFVAGQPLGVIAAWRRSFAATRGHGLVLMALACVPLLGGSLLALPFDALGQSANGAPMANPVVAGLLDLLSSAAHAACAVAALLLEIAVYRRLMRGT